MSLPCCKPGIRRKADLGDLVVAVSSKKVHPSQRPSPTQTYVLEDMAPTTPCGNVVGAMWVHEKDSRATYDVHHPERVPSPENIYGDCLYGLDDLGRWYRYPPPFHGTVTDYRRDLGSKSILLSNEGGFYYWGVNSVKPPPPSPSTSLGAVCVVTVSSRLTGRRGGRS